MEASRKVRLENLHHEWAQGKHKPNLRHKRWLTRSDTELSRNERGLVYAPGGRRGATRQEQGAPFLSEEREIEFRAQGGKSGGARGPRAGGQRPDANSHNKWAFTRVERGMHSNSAPLTRIDTTTTRRSDWLTGRQGDAFYTSLSKAADAAPPPPPANLSRMPPAATIRVALYLSLQSLATLETTAASWRDPIRRAVQALTGASGELEERVLKEIKAKFDNETGEWSMEKEEKLKFFMTPEDHLAIKLAAASSYRCHPELLRKDPLQQIKREQVKHHAKAPTTGHESWARVLRYGLSLNWRRLQLPTGLAKGSTAHHSIVVDEEGEGAGDLLAFGWNNAGQTGLGQYEPQALPMAIATLNEQYPRSIVGAAVGTMHSLAVDDEGCVFSWGSNKGGALGLGHERSFPVPQEVIGITTRRVLLVTAGTDFSLALDDTGVLHSWGAPLYGVLGHGSDRRQELSPRPVEALQRIGQVVAVSAGHRHVLAVTTGGCAYSWGFGGDGALGLGDGRQRLVPERIELPSANDHSDELTHPEASYGHPYGYRHADAVDPHSHAHATTVRGVTYNSTANHTEAVAANLATTGHSHLSRHSNAYSHRHLQSHAHAHSTSYSNNRIESVSWPLPGPKVTSESLDTSGRGSYAGTSSGGYGRSGGHGRSGGYGVTQAASTLVNSTQRSNQPPGGSRSGSRSGSFGNSMGFGDLLADSNEFSETGGTVADHEHDHVVMVAAGRTHSLLITSSGRLFSCGGNEFGQLGRTTPAHPNRSQTPRAWNFGLVVLSEGDGARSGNATTSGSTAALETKATECAAGGSHSLVVSAGGVAWSFGANKYGQLGLGQTKVGNSVPLPQRIYAFRGYPIVTVSAGEAHSLFLGQTGTVQSCGQGGNGQLGLLHADFAVGDNSDRCSPGRVDLPGRDDTI